MEKDVLRLVEVLDAVTDANHPSSDKAVFIPRILINELRALHAKLRDDILEGKVVDSEPTSTALQPTFQVSTAVFPVTDMSPAARFIAAYVGAYTKRYGYRPVLDGKTQGQIKSFLRGATIEEAINLIQVYCQMDDAWFLTKHHDFTTFLGNLNKVAGALKTGCADSKTAIDWNKIDLEAR